MVVGVGAVRGLFVAGFVGWYSTGIFKAMDNHYGSQFGVYLKEQLSANKHMRRDVEAERDAMGRLLEAKGMSLPSREHDDGLNIPRHPPIQGRDVSTRAPPSRAGSDDDLPDVQQTPGAACTAATVVCEPGSPSGSHSGSHSGSSGDYCSASPPETSYCKAGGG